jgi:hypothetical protein
MCTHSCWEFLCAKNTSLPHISQKIEQARHFHAKVARDMFLFFLSCCLIHRQFFAIGRQICPVGIRIFGCLLMSSWNWKTNLSNWNC